MACTTQKTSPIPVQLQSKPNVTERYYVEVERCGTAGQYSFKTSAKRKSDNEIIGRTTSTGFIILENLTEDEKPKQDIIKRQIKQAFKTAKNFTIGNNLTNLERTLFLNQLGFQNTAINEDDGNGTTITGGENDDNNAEKFEYNLTNTTIDVSIGGRRFRKQYGHFSYPEDLRTNKQDRVRFTQSYSEGTKIDATITSGEKNFQRKVKKVRGSVTLPIVTGIEDTSAVDWNDGKLNPIQALAGASALGIFQQVRQSGDIADAFRTAAGGLNRARMEMQGQVGSDLQSAINVYLAQQAVGTQGLLSRTTGAILNPNLELLFGGPKLRSFGFSFKLSARDANEADQIRKIIRFFKQGMSVKTSSSNVFLKAPNIFDIQYQTFNTDGTEIVHPSINIIKTCALTSCNIQYTPDGTYMTYEDPYRTLTSYQLTMQFSELDPIYDSDYSELDEDRDQVIGY